jgi:hypothetical protein
MPFKKSLNIIHDNLLLLFFNQVPNLYIYLPHKMLNKITFNNIIL